MSEEGLPPELTKLNPMVLRSFRTAFSALDPMNSGTILLTELPMALRSLSLAPSDKDLKSLTDEFLRGTIRVPFLLFCRVAARQYSSVRTPKAMARLFSLWDPNNTGVVTQAAVRDIFGKLSPAPMTPPDYVDALINYADPTGSGSVKYAEFCEKLFKDYDAAVKITGTV